jgi:hypothetical protein
MGLPALRLRHCSKFFLFFNSGSDLLSCKWIQEGSSGYYEFCECKLGKTVKVLKKDKVEWDGYEAFLKGWLDCHGGLVFDKTKIFNIVWEFFVVRNDKWLSSQYDPFVVYDTLSGDERIRMLRAMDIVEEILKSNTNVSTFWNGKAMEIVSRYAHWVDRKNPEGVE